MLRGTWCFAEKLLLEDAFGTDKWKKENDGEYTRHIWPVINGGEKNALSSFNQYKTVAVALSVKMTDYGRSSINAQLRPTQRIQDRILTKCWVRELHTLPSKLPLTTDSGYGKGKRKTEKEMERKLVTHKIWWIVVDALPVYGFTDCADCKWRRHMHTYLMKVIYHSGATTTTHTHWETSKSILFHFYR